MVQDLKQLCNLAAARNDTCNAALRGLVERRKEILEEEKLERQRELELELATRAREAEEKESLRRAADEDEDDVSLRKAGKNKKRKTSSSTKEDRPLNHGAHGLARQDGLNLPLKGTVHLFRIESALSVDLEA